MLAQIVVFCFEQPIPYSELISNLGMTVLVKTVSTLIYFLTTSLLAHGQYHED